MHDVPDQAYQPSNFSFPRREFGKSALVKRAFQASWFIAMYNTSDSSPGKISHSALCAGIKFDLHRRRRGILNTSLNAKFASVIKGNVAVLIKTLLILIKANNYLINPGWPPQFVRAGAGSASQWSADPH